MGELGLEVEKFGLGVGELRCGGELVDEMGHLVDLEEVEFGCERVSGG